MKSECCGAPVNSTYDAEYNKVFYDCTQCGVACGFTDV